MVVVAPLGGERPCTSAGLRQPAQRNRAWRDKKSQIKNRNFFDFLAILGYFGLFWALFGPFGPFLDPKIASGAPKDSKDPTKIGQKGVKRPYKCVLGPFKTIWMPF